MTKYIEIVVLKFKTNAVNTQRVMYNFCKHFFITQASTILEKSFEISHTATY